MEKNMKYNFNKDTTIGEVLDSDEGLSKVLMGFGLHCFGCPMSQMETLEEAAEVHGVDIGFMLDKLNNYEKPSSKATNRKAKGQRNSSKTEKK